METNDKFLSLPPFLSTTWRNVRSLHMKGDMLVVTLADGCTVEIPQLSSNTIDNLFLSHAKFLDHQGGQRLPNDPLKNKEVSRATKITEGLEQGLAPFRMGIGAFDSFGTVLQHNPQHANAPDLPPEILHKISSVAKIVAPDDVNALPKAEPHCNCIHCQIARAIGRGMEVEREEEAALKEMEEAVLPEELTFKEWDIHKTGEHMYLVTNPLDEKEKYSVFLGNPVGCTCGQTNCEHIVAVLRSY